MIAVCFVLGRPSLDVNIELQPSRVTVGTAAAGRLVVTNQSRARLRPLSVEVPIGPALASSTCQRWLRTPPMTQSSYRPSAAVSSKSVRPGRYGPTHSG